MDYRKRDHRRRNYEEPGNAHELTFSCYHGFQFLAAERTCVWLAEAISAARAKHQFSLWACVFMPEHVHLIIWPRLPVYHLDSIRSDIKEPVGRKAIAYLSQNSPAWLARVTRKRGKRTERLFWQSGGGYDRNTVQPSTLKHMIAYIHANPVRRGLVERPEDWRWSSASTSICGTPGPLALDPIVEQWLE